MSLLIPVDAFDCKCFEIDFKNMFLFSIILNSKPKILGVEPIEFC